MSIPILQFLLEVMLGTIVFLHLTKKNTSSALAYGLQSLAITAILFGSYLETNSLPLLLVTIFVFMVKVIIAPVFFLHLIKKYDRTFSVSTYLNTPLTLIISAILIVTAHSQKFAALTSIIPEHQALLSLALSAVFLSLFLIVNRKGAITQITGILSLENSIAVFIILAGLEQSAALQLGIVFNIFIWLIISTVFMAMIYRHFGSLNITALNHLKD